MDVLKILGIIVLGVICFVILMIIYFICRIFLPLIVTLISAIIFFIIGHDNIGVISILIGIIAQYLWSVSHSDMDFKNIKEIPKILADIFHGK